MQVIKTVFGGGSDFALESLLRLAASDRASLEIGIVEIPQDYRHPTEGASIHEQDEISLILSGRLEIECNERTTTLEAGDVVVIPAGEPHASRSLEDARIYFALFGPVETDTSANRPENRSADRVCNRNS